MHYLGMAGMPRRYSQMTEVAYLHDLIPLQKFITYAAFITIAGQLIFLVNLFWSMFKGKKASRQSVGSDHARMDYRDAAASRQFWRAHAGGAQRAV